MKCWSQLKLEESGGYKSELRNGTNEGVYVVSEDVFGRKFMSFALMLVTWRRKTEAFQGSRYQDI